MRQSFFVTVLIILAFLCGKYFAESQEKEGQKQDPPRVFIEQLKTKMNISKNQNNIEIFLNGEKMTDNIKVNLTK